VAFDAEEIGLIGSGHFVTNIPVPINNIKMMFSFDMVGMCFGGEFMQGWDLMFTGSP